MKISCSYNFLAENRFLHIFNMFKILSSRLHYDVIKTSYVDGWYLFWDQWNEETHSYTVVANIRVSEAELDQNLTHLMS